MAREKGPMARRLFSILLTTCLLILSGVVQLRASNAPMEVPDYSRLLNFIAMEDRQDPLVAFGTAEKDFDRRLNKENIAFLNQDKDLMRQIQSKLKGEELRWRLSNSFKQLLVVPENREDYARLFEQYCRASVDYLLKRIHMSSPYDQIATLKGTAPSPAEAASTKGVTVYLVHNMVDEYIEEYLFFGRDEDGDEAKIRVKLRNRAVDAKVGSYTSRLRIGDDNRFEFIREPYTLWQNSAKNPLNVLIVPIEETLHILVRSYTEAAIQGDLARSKPTRLEEVQQVIDSWMAVEEAIVGGVVSQVMPEVLARFVPQESTGQLEEALAERDAHRQYRFLNQAIHLVTDLGVDQALTVYRKDPRVFKDLLDQSPSGPTLRSAQNPQSPTRVN